jgi:transcriptional regulator with XRE-family HTH domain
MRRRNPAHTKRLLACNIRDLRLQKSWSQYDLADEASVRQALISALEVGKANPTLQSPDRIAIALGLELAEFLMPPKKVLPDAPTTEDARAEAEQRRIDATRKRRSRVGRS